MYEFLLWIGTHIGILFTANTILLAFVIILENREPERSQGWLIVLFAFPIIGFLLYLFVGHNWHRKNSKTRLAMSESTKKWKQDVTETLRTLHITNPTEKRIRLLATSMTGLLPTSGNHIRVLTNAQEKYPRLVESLKSAKKSIDMEYFCFRYDDFGKEVIEILKERSRAGVHIRFLVDGYGSMGLGAKAFHGMRAAGIKAHYFAPLATLLYFFKANYRDHRKVVVVDEKIVFTGGINIGLDYLGQTHRGGWRDTAIELTGPAVTQFVQEFDISWRRTTFQVPEPRLPIQRHAIPDESGDIINVIPSGPDSSWFAIQRLYLEMISSAQHSILIQTPYFIPDSNIYEALINAALRGVEVIINVPKYTDVVLCDWVAITYFGELLRAGAKIYHYPIALLHQKIMIVDNSIASIGTCNIDLRSLKTDFEINVLTSSSETIQRLMNDAHQDLDASIEYTHNDYLRRPLFTRIKESFARLIAPLL